MITEGQMAKIQRKLIEAGIDGWLLYDCDGSNKFARRLLAITPEMVVTRRFFYWIPKKGDPLKIVHKIESEALDHLPGNKETYQSYEELEKLLLNTLAKKRKVAMEYSPKNANPYVSVVDAGTIELIQAIGGAVVSSADLLQQFTSVLDANQMESHKRAAEVLVETLDKAWDLITQKIRQNAPITEHDVQQFILSEFAAKSCITEDGPSCSVNENSAYPHYVASKKKCKRIERGDFILIDLWCKEDRPESIYADITRVAVAASEPTPKQEEVFQVVKRAQEACLALIDKRVRGKKPLLGQEVDDACRKVIVEAGYGPYFTHRTGHNIDTNVHGSGVHLDNFETADSRKILPSTCFSIEPGIYLPNEFGVRTECNILIHPDATTEITSPLESNIVCLL